MRMPPLVGSAFGAPERGPMDFQFLTEIDVPRVEAWPPELGAGRLSLSDPLYIDTARLQSVSVDEIALRIQLQLGSASNRYRLCTSDGGWWIYYGGLWRSVDDQWIAEYLIRQFSGAAPGSGDSITEGTTVRPQKGARSPGADGWDRSFACSPLELRGVLSRLRGRISVAQTGGPNPVGEAPISTSRALASHGGRTLVLGPGGPAWLDSAPELYCGTALRYPYQPGQTPDKLLSYLRSVTWLGAPEHDREQRIECLRQFFGVAVLGCARQVPDKRVLLLYGASGSGKSTLLNVLWAMLPPGAWQSVVPQQLGLRGWEGDSARARLGHSTANIVADMPADTLPVDGLLKSVVSCEPVSARAVRGVEHRITPRAVHIWACNEIPPWLDAANSWRRRVVLVHFARAIPASDQGHGDVVGRILAEEGEQMQNWAIDGALSMLQSRYTLPDSSAELLDEHERDHARSEELFLRDCVGAGDTWTTASALYGAYRDYCQARGLSISNSSVLGKHLRQTNFPKRKLDGYTQYKIRYLKPQDRVATGRKASEPPN